MQRTTKFGSRILLLIPHPDDEVVACSAAIGHARAAGAEIFAAYLTHGCVATRELWPWQQRHAVRKVKRRWREAQHVAKLLGITPVLWSKRPARTLWRNLPDVKQEVLKLMARHMIDQLWVPAYEGGNADHDGLNGIIATLSPTISILEFAEYNWHNGYSHSHRLPNPTADMHTLWLTPEEQALKAVCLAQYRSEKRNLSAIQTIRECFRPLAAYNYQQPPHTGLLWYQRFQWVWFHHPDIDRTQPEQVCAAIMACQQPHSS